MHRPSNIVNVRLRQRTHSIHLTLAEIFGSYSGLSSPLHLPLSQAHFILLVLLLLRYYSTSLVGLSTFHIFHCGQLDTVGPVDPSKPIYIYTTVDSLIMHIPIRKFCIEKTLKLLYMAMHYEQVDCIYIYLYYFI